MPKSRRRAPTHGRGKANSGPRRIASVSPRPMDERSMALAAAESVLAVAPRQRMSGNSSNRAQLNMSIVTGVGGDSSSLALHRETELVRAGLLYADHVTLLSPRARLISAASSLEGASTKDLIAVFAEFARRVPQEPQVMAVLPQLGPLLTVIEDPLLRTLLPSDALADIEAALSEFGKRETEHAGGGGRD